MSVLQMSKRDEHSPAECRNPEPKEVLAELFMLLEEFGPSWYTEEHHERAKAALGRQ